MPSVIEKNINKFFYSFFISRLFTQIFPNQVVSVEIKHRNIIFNLNIYHDSPMFLNVFKFVKKSFFFGFRTLSDMWAVDFPGNYRHRFQIYYRFTKIINSGFFNYDGWLTFNLKIKSSSTLSFSVSSVFPSSAWLEREIWDMFGIYFTNNQDLRRILTDYGFEGFPLRKDFPTTGYVALRYDFESKKTVLEPLDFSFGQEYRYFDFRSPWRL